MKAKGRAYLACVAAVALAAAAPAVASASPAASSTSVNLLQATPAATSTGASGVVANNAVYVDCPILLFPEEPCIVYYIQNRGVSSVTFYTSSGATAKGSYNCKASYCDVSFVGTPIGDDNYATAWTIFGPAIRDAETTAG